MQRLNRMILMAIGLAVHAPSLNAQVVRARPPATSENYIEKVVRLRNETAALAFDPDKLFEKRMGQSKVVTIAYSGDDFGWPVYSIAISRNGCIGRDSKGIPCRWQRIARMVRAPAPPDFSRPRQRGSHLMQRMLRSDEPASASIDGMGLEWMEADLDTCPGANVHFEQAGRISWIPNEVFAPSPDNLPPIILHADTVKVTFSAASRLAIYQGYIAEGSPAEWAVKLAEILESCWRPSQADPPWRR